MATLAPGTATTDTRTLADGLIRFLKTNRADADVFSDDVFADVTVPQWRLQSQGREALSALRRQSHPDLGEVPRHRYDPTPTGFVLEVEETWRNQEGDWYARELAQADVASGKITTLSI